jgi:hypothetical protein
VDTAAEEGAVVEQDTEVVLEGGSEIDLPLPRDLMGIEVRHGEDHRNMELGGVIPPEVGVGIGVSPGVPLGGAGAIPGVSPPPGPGRGQGQGRDRGRRHPGEAVGET